MGMVPIIGVKAEQPGLDACELRDGFLALAAVELA